MNWCPNYGKRGDRGRPGFPLTFKKQTPGCQNYPTCVPAKLNNHWDYGAAVPHRSSSSSSSSSRNNRRRRRRSSSSSSSSSNSSSR